MKSARVTRSDRTDRSPGFGLGRKLGLGFASLTLLSVGLGGLGLERMTVMNARTAEVATKDLPSAIWSGKIGLALEEVQRFDGGYLLTMSSDIEERAMLKQGLARAIAAVEEARRRYDSFIDPGEQRDRFTRIYDPLWPRFRADVEKTIDAEDSGDDAAAMGLYKSVVRSEMASLVDFIQWDMTYNQAQGARAGDGARRVYHATFWTIVGAMAAAIVLSLAITLGLVRHIAAPIAAMTSAMRRLAGRDMHVEIPCVGRGDEIGRMAGAVKVFKDSMIAADRLAEERNAGEAARLERTRSIESLVGGFEAQIGGTVSMLSTASMAMEATARAMSGAAVQTNQRATEVARAASESNVGVQTVAAASEHLAASIGDINRQVSSSSTLTTRCVGSVRQTDETVRVLAESAERIGQVVGLISSIAGQTTLLALNATIEAARAGEAGKGFAVVASEVKLLAQQTTKATDEISQQIGAVQSASEAAVAAIREISSMIEEAGAITTSIAASVEQQGVATKEIARNVAQTASSTGRVSSNIAGVSQVANETGAAAAQVLSAAGDLSRQAKYLSVEVDGFIAKVRAA